MQRHFPSTMTSKTDSNKAVSDAQKAEEKASKEELVEAKMRIIRKKNEELMRRQKEIEEDRKNADVYSKLVEIKKQHGDALSGVSNDSSQPEGVAGRGQGRGRGLMLQEMRKETLKAKQWEAKRKENVMREEEERKQGRSSNSASRFLVDDRRVDMSKMAGRNEHSWGGANFGKAASRMQREKEGFRSDRSRDNMVMHMSGRERQQYHEWKDERRKIDEERRARQKKAGNWSRTWDQKKVWDARRRMWVFEESEGSAKDVRRYDGHGSAQDWGNDSRGNNYYGENRGRKGGGFRHYDNHETQASEIQRNSNRSEVLENKRTGSKTERGALEKEKHNRDGTANGESLGKENWEEERSKPVTQKKEEKSADAALKTSTEISQRIGQPKPQRERRQRRKTKECDINEDNQNNQESVADKEVTSNEPHSKTPHHELGEKAQDDLQDSQEQPESTTTEELSSSDASALHESSGDKKGPAVVCRDQVNNLHEENAETQVDPEHTDTGEIAHEKATVTTDSDTGKKSHLPENPADEKQDTSNDQSTQNEQKDHSANSARNDLTPVQKANLPKLKVDEKVSFDTEESNQKMDADRDVTSTTQASTSVVADIPPTPDFLKLEEDINWGEIEIDEEGIVERW